MRYLFLFFSLIILLFGSCRKDEVQLLGEVLSEVLLAAPIRLDTNPHAPLTAFAHVETNVPTYLQVTVTGAAPLHRTFRDSTSRHHRIPVVGLYPGVENELVIRIEDAAASRFALDTVRFTTPPLPDYLPAIRIDRADSARMEPGWTLAELNIGGNGNLRTVPIAFDRHGVIRWFVDLQAWGSWMAPFEPMQNGHFLFAKSWGVFSIDETGNEVDRWGMSGYSQHHDAVELPNGDFLLPASDASLLTSLDQMVVMGRDSGGVQKVWDFRDVLDVDRYDLLLAKSDWLHVNSVWFDPSDDGVIVSARHQGVFKVSADNQLQWILAPHRGWGKAGAYEEGPETAEFLLTAVNPAGQPFETALQEGREGTPDFRWPWGQHAAMLLPNGNILLFDNGWNRHFTYDEADFSRVVEYEIDESARTVKQTWQYGEERGAELYSPNISDADFLPESGHVLMISGNIHHAGQHYAKVIEIDYPGKEAVFEATLLFKNKFSTGTGWGDADMVYRGERTRLWK